MEIIVDILLCLSLYFIFAILYTLYTIITFQPPALINIFRTFGDKKSFGFVTGQTALDFWERNLLFLTSKRFQMSNYLAKLAPFWHIPFKYNMNNENNMYGFEIVPVAFKGYQNALIYLAKGIACVILLLIIFMFTNGGRAFPFMYNIFQFIHKSKYGKTLYYGFNTVIVIAFFRYIGKICYCVYHQYVKTSIIYKEHRKIYDLVFKTIDDPTKEEYERVKNIQPWKEFETLHKEGYEDGKISKVTKLVKLIKKEMSEDTFVNKSVMQAIYNNYTDPPLQKDGLVDETTRVLLDFKNYPIYTFVKFLVIDRRGVDFGLFSLMIMYAIDATFKIAYKLNPMASLKKANPAPIDLVSVLTIQLAIAFLCFLGLSLLFVTIRMYVLKFINRYINANSMLKYLIRDLRFGSHALEDVTTIPINVREITKAFMRRVMKHGGITIITAVIISLTVAFLVIEKKTAKKPMTSSEKKDAFTRENFIELSKSICIFGAIVSLLSYYVSNM